MNGNETKKSPKFSDIIVFVGRWLHKDNLYNAENLDDYLLEKPLEEVAETIPLDISGRDELQPIGFDQVKFKEDCFAMYLEYNIPSSKIADNEWGLNMMLNEMDFDEVFKDFKTDLINLGKAQLKKINEPPEIGKLKLDDILKDLTLEQKTVNAIRIFTAWDFWMSPDEEDTEWKLVGIIDPNKIIVDTLL